MGARKLDSKKELQGTARNDRKPEFSGVFLKNAPAMPAGLDAKGKTIWKGVIKGLIESELLCEADLTSVEAYARCMSGYFRIEKQVRNKTYPEVVEYMTDEGTLRHSQAHAAVNLSLQYLAQANKIAATLGATPKARQALAMVKKEAQSDFEKFLSE